MHPVWSELINTANLSDTLLDLTQPAFSNQADSEAALRQALVCPLPHLGAIRVEGEDAAGFLHNLTSNDVKKLAAGSTHWNSLNSPKGRMIANFLLSRDQQGFTLVLAAELAADVAKKLSMYVLRAKVKVSDLSATSAIMGVLGEQAGAKLQAQGLVSADTKVSLHDLGTTLPYPAPAASVARYLILSPKEHNAALWQKLSAAGVIPASAATWQHADIEAGIPLVTTATREEFIAQMLNYELLGGVSFQKGCYPGQEIVARTQYLGKLKKRMYLAHVEDAQAPLPGQDLYAPEFGEQSCGKIVNVSPAPQGGYDLLVVVQMSAYEAGVIHLHNPSGPALRLGSLPYAID